MNKQLPRLFLLVYLTFMLGTVALIPTGWAQPTDPLVCKFGKFEVLLGKQCIDQVIGDTPTAQQKGIVKTIDFVIKLVLGTVVGLGLIMVVVGGYVYMTAGGNAQRIGAAKTIIGAAILGIVLALVAQLLLNTISPQFASDIRIPFKR